MNRASRTAALATLVLLASRAGALPTVPPTAPAPPPPPARPSVAAQCELHAGQVFTGSYVCSQGSTELALHVLEVHGERVRAEFDFDWAHGRVRGSFTLAGTCDGRTRAWSMAPERWIDAPSNWVMVGMRGTLAPGARGYVGAIDDPSCTGFAVNR